MYNNNVVKSDLLNLTAQFKSRDYFENKTILITGGTGLISSYLILYFHHLNEVHDSNINMIINVRSEARLKKKLGIDLKDYQIIEKSVQDLNVVDVESQEVDYIFHLAGSSSPYAINNMPTDIIEANVNGTLGVLNIAKVKSSKVYYSSTREVYGATGDLLVLSEGDMGVLDHTQVRSCYPESKRMAENLIISYNHQFKIDYVMNRIAHVYGPGMAITNDGRIMSDLIGNVVNGEDIALISDGSALRAFCYVTDAIDGILRSFVNGNNEIYNLSNEEEEISILELSKTLITTRPELDLKVTYVEAENKQSIGYLPFKRVALNNEKLYALNWKPCVTLKDGLDNTVKFNLLEKQ